MLTYKPTGLYNLQARRLSLTGHRVRERTEAPAIVHRLLLTSFTHAALFRRRARHLTIRR